jgi:hypothetical protein
MAQRKETKTKIKVHDLKPKKDAKGGFMVFGSTRQQGAGHHQMTGGTHQQSGPNLGK